MIGFWSLAFVYVWTGAHHMLHGPISQWLQTIAITFSRDAADSGLGRGLQLLRHHEGPVAPVARKRAAQVPDVGHRLLPAHLLPGSDAQPAHVSTPSSPRPTGFPATRTWRCWALLLLRHRRHLLHRAAHVAAPSCTSDALANWSFWFIMIGGLGFFVTLWLGGFWQGWQWNNPAIPFIDTVMALQAHLAGALLLRRPDLPRHRGVRVQHHGARRGAGGRTYVEVKPITARRWAVGGALVLFFIGGLLTTVVPPLVDKSWGRLREQRSRQGPTGKLSPTPSSSSRAAPSTCAKAAGIATRSRPAPWSPTPSAPAGTASIRPSPRRTNSSTTARTCSAPSAPAPIFRASAASTTRSGIARISAIRATWCPARVMPPFPWIVNNPEEFAALVAYLQTLGRAKDWRPDQRLREVRPWTTPGRASFSPTLFFALSAVLRGLLLRALLEGRLLGQGTAKSIKFQMLAKTTKDEP